MEDCEYLTPDLGKASIIITVTGHWPDEYLRLDGQKEQVVYKWHKINYKVKRQLAHRELKVEPLSLIQNYRDLKNKTFKILDEDKK